MSRQMLYERTKRRPQLQQARELATSTVKIEKLKKKTIILKPSFSLYTTCQTLKTVTVSYWCITTLTVTEAQYKLALIRHVMKYAICRQQVYFQQKRVEFRLAELFATINRERAFVVPATTHNTFMAAIDESSNKHVNIKLMESHLENIKTPEEVKVKLEMIKNVEKAKSAETNGCYHLFKNKMNHVIPSYVSSFFNPNDFHLYKGSHENEKADTARKVDEMVRSSTQFLEAVILMENHWFFVTSLCVLVHDKNLDDCADMSKIGPQDEVIAFIRRKTRTGRDSFELTLRFSNIELLCKPIQQAASLVLRVFVEAVDCKKAKAFKGWLSKQRGLSAEEFDLFLKKS
ncbi:hypothetical protein EDC96DRAFT_588604 [Choanephora cucurbitarum]|nr:hypothetical protein EDC96DRAFT_588604 [Choanephora cucurbitarum]